ncbi:AAA family ATPase [Streptomyces sp. SID8379]|uniref:AAA family ATPase n=1 Tax=unclassified Streptomyces TaxID=2593676 RepID=UPI00039DE7BB|nr:MULTISPECIES: AAA family ATPase [unclassified Streptomyces]MYW65793.1 AAA family ATPase [Streptomyces sp. SID8379]
MKILRLKVENIGGLHDCEIALPDREMIALAGANGTGKSKMLACLLSPWTNTIPAPRDPSARRAVSVTIQFDEREVAALIEFVHQSHPGWAISDSLREATYDIWAEPMVGSLNVRTQPDVPSLWNCFRNQNFLQRYPSFNLVFLPAERRMVSNYSTSFDLAQLAEEVALEKTSEARNTAHSGVLDDGEFENYAKALCVAGSLPNEENFDGDAEVSKWQSFRGAVDLLLYPKFLMPLTRQNPDRLRVGLPGGGSHSIYELSSGERQALVIISRVFRAGEGHSVIAIDEPDAYLHPALSTKLLAALGVGLQTGGRLLLATHSPSILDSMPPQAIFRLHHSKPPAIVESEGARIDLYREAGFKASALTQASLLVATEGEFDEGILPQLVPLLGSANIRGRGGRAQVIRALESLAEYDVPIIGVVDADIMAPPPSRSVASRCFIWPTADIEGVLLSDDAFLQAAIDGYLVRAPFRSLDKLKDLLAKLSIGVKGEVVAELAQRILRSNDSFAWPTPRGDSAIDRLRQAADLTPKLSASDIESAITQAEAEWNKALPNLWALVRGKRVLGDFVSTSSDFKRGPAFLEAVASRSPRIQTLERFEAFARAALEAGS